MSLFAKTESYLGVDIGAGGIKLVEVHKTKNRPQLWTYGILDQPLDIHVERREKTAEELAAEQRQGIEVPGKKKEKDIPIHLDDPRIEKYASLLRTLLKSAKTTTRRATASLPVSYVFHSLVTMPYTEEKKRDDIVRAEVAKIISRPVSEMQIVHQVVPSQEKKPKYLRLLVTAAPKDLVAFYSAIFQKAGLQLEELETEAFALERSLVGRDPATAMIVDVGSERTNFFIMDQGLPMTHRSIQIGGNDISAVISRVTGLSALTDQAKRDIARIAVDKIPADLFLSVINPIVKEIEYGFDLFLSQSGNEVKRPEKIILTGGTGVFPPIQKKIAELFNMRVFVGDPWARMVYQQGLRPVLDDIGPRMSVCIGLALRNCL